MLAKDSFSTLNTGQRPGDLPDTDALRNIRASFNCKGIPACPYIISCQHIVCNKVYFYKLMINLAAEIHFPNNETIRE
jgi:hypothetical protein